MPTNIPPRHAHTPETPSRIPRRQPGPTRPARPSWAVLALYAAILAACIGLLARIAAP